MDEQSKPAVELSTKQSASSPRRPDNPKPQASLAKSPLAHAHDDEAASDAETIVLPGKDGISPSKPRKTITIKHEEKSEGEVDDTPPIVKKPLKDVGPEGRDRDRARGDNATDDGFSALSKKKRPVDRNIHRSKDASSGLSSVPASPPTHHRNPSSARPRRPSRDARSGSDSESARPRSPRPPKDKAKSVDRLLKRKAPKNESDDEDDMHKAQRQRIADAHKASSGKSLHDRHPASRARSNSPHARLHRRSASTQLPGHGPNGLAKKRRPAPLMSTDYQSDDSSASGSPHPRSSRLKSVATPAMGDSTFSPAKMPGVHKKHLDAHGQTLFAKACAKGEYEVAKMRLQERPEDLNFSDHAGNTPLQVACLNGHEDIVKLLIEAGCNLDCRNDDKDTPLLDAVENGHLEVVKTLLAAGVNPRRPNAEGQEPIEKIPDDIDNAQEIRAVLVEARQKIGELRRTSEDHQLQDAHDGLSSHGADSPRRSPAASVSGALSTGASRRGGTVRSTKTSNHLLYMSLDDKTLRQAAARGDSETVTRVLQVKESCDDAEALVAAARGGHNFVMELLLALGGANPDPAPVKTLPTEHSTPMLAAIGGENTKVIQLLLNQSGFDPTRRFKGETYYEIARRREGPMWKEEEHMLKNSYDDHKKMHKTSSRAKSPTRRDPEQETKRSIRAEPTPDSVARVPKRRPSSPGREPDAKKKHATNKAPGSPLKEKRRSSFSNAEDPHSPKRGPGRPRKDEKISSIAISDRETSPASSSRPPSTKPRRADSEMAGSSEGEAAKPRRKLISGKDLKGQREKQRRASVISTNSARDASDRADGKHEEPSEKPRSDRISEKYHDRTKALKRDDSRDRLSLSDSSSKRHRPSASPPRQAPGDKEEADGPIKRRRLDIEGKEKRSRQTSSPDDRQRKREVSRDAVKRQKPQEERRDSSKLKKASLERRDSDYPSSEEKASITVFSQDMDVDMPDVPPPASAIPVRDAQIEREKAQAKKRQAELEAATEESRRKEEERQRQEAERRKREAEDKRQREELEKKRLEEEKQRREEEELRRKEAEEKAREKARLEEERIKHEEERLRQEEEERKRKEAEERQRREEEERARREREAAEEARRQEEEEEERKERERQKAAQEAEQRRIMQEQEKLRLARLPPLLRWLDLCPSPQQRETAELFSIMQGVRYDTISPAATGKPGGREQWLLNTQVALLLGDKDLDLRKCKPRTAAPACVAGTNQCADASWERIPVSQIAKKVIWRLEQDRYALTEGRLYHLGEQLPDYYGGNPNHVGYRRLEQLRGEASKLFFETNMFFVKVGVARQRWRQADG